MRKLHSRPRLGLIIYHSIVTVLTLWSVVNLGLMIGHIGDFVIEKAIMDGLLAVFASDYFVRLAMTHNRKVFLVQSAFDLLGIIPMHPVFAIFRLGRLVRLIRYYHLFWHLGLSGRWTKLYHRFIYNTGFIYLFSISVAIIVLSALLFSISEKQTLANSLWWAVTTATTVGYGDETAHTGFGRIIAAILMFGGIGFIGLLTSTITDFFTSRTSHTRQQAQIQHADMQRLTTKIETLTAKVDQLEKQLADQQHKKV